MGCCKSQIKSEETRRFLFGGGIRFYDEFATEFIDNDNADLEDRFLMLGFSNESRLLIVCHCEHCADEIIRIFSARKATRNKRKHYEGGRP